MSYWMMITPEEDNILTENNIEYTYWDVEDIILNNPDKAEIEFETLEELNKARELLGLKPFR